jgi:hypothetical protein
VPLPKCNRSVWEQRPLAFGSSATPRSAFWGTYALDSLPAAKLAGRRFFGIELDAEYYARAAKRLARRPA